MAERSGEESQRLRRVYGDMTDGQLEEMATRPQDLTVVAAGVLHDEMRRRGLAVPQSSKGLEEGNPDEEVGVPAAAEVIASNLGAWGPEMELTTFYDAMDAGRACEFLDGAGIPFHVADVSDRSSLGSFEGAPAVALRITVLLSDLDRARGVLRGAMGLFPEQEVEEADEALDDGTKSIVGLFPTRREAEEIAAVLTGAGIWNEVVEVDEDRENPFAVEVKEVDLLRAGTTVEKALS